MKRLKILVSIIALAVLSICFYCFLLGNNIFEGKFANDVISWYFLAKGLFCSVALLLLVSIIEALQKK